MSGLAETDGPSPEDESKIRARIVELYAQSELLEELMVRLSRTGRIGNVTPAGQARSAMIGAALALEPGDMVFGTTRDLPAALARGVTIADLMAQAFGVVGDPGCGRGMPGAIAHGGARVSLSDGSPAAHLVHASGFGQAARAAGEGGVALALLGTGALQQGEVHAAFNFAAVSRSQVIFVARGPRAGELPLVEMAPAWGIDAIAVDVEGEGVAPGWATYRAAREARARAVAGAGPVVVDARWEVEPTPERDRVVLEARGEWDAKRDRTARAAVEALLDVARSASEQGAMPERDSMFESVFADRPWWLQEGAPS